MLITQTPLRISFLGGGTDFPGYFKHNGGGAVLGTAIDKFIFLSISRFYSELFDYSIRISYRKVECTSSVHQIEHAPYRECLKWCGIERDVEINCAAELPAFTGLGSSSSFVVGLLNTINSFRGKMVSPLDLAYQAIELEQDVLQEAVGCQDQIFAAFGGFNLVEFFDRDKIVVHRIPLSLERREEFKNHLMLFYTGLRRKANDLTKRQIEKININTEHLSVMHKMVDQGHRILTQSGSLASFGELLDQAWKRKRSLDSKISNSTINQIYDLAKESGALGGKLLGAGGGGFLLFFVPLEKQPSVRNALKHLTEVTVNICAPGSHVIHA